MKTTGSLLGTMSGSIGGATASRNRGGQYFRQRVIPTNPNSSRQAAVRAIFAGLVSAWNNSLTAAERAAWATYATNTPRTGPLGTEVVLTGQQNYIGANTQRLQSGLARVDAAPTIFNRGESPTTIEAGTSNNPNEIEFATAALLTGVAISAPATDDGDCLLFIGPPVNPTVNYWKGPYQLAAVQAFAATDVLVGFTTAFAALTIDEPLVGGQYRPAKAVLLYDDGRYSIPFESICLVVDTTP